MDRKILIKELDKFTNKDNSRVISEFIIYYMIDGKYVEAYTELGDDNKRLRVNEVLLKYFVDDSNICWEHAVYPIEEILIK